MAARGSAAGNEEAGTAAAVSSTTLGEGIDSNSDPDTSAPAPAAPTTFPVYYANYACCSCQNVEARGTVEDPTPALP